MHTGLKSKLIHTINRIGRYLDLSKGIGTRSWWLRSLSIVAVTALLQVISAGTSDRTPSADEGPSTREGSIVASAPLATEATLGNDVGELDPIEQANIAEPVQSPPKPNATLNENSRLVLKSGQPLMTALQGAGADRQQAWAAIQALSDHMDMRRLSAGQAFDLKWDGGTGSGLIEVAARDQFDRKIYAVKEGGSFISRSETIPTLALSRYANSEITDSLFLTAERAGVPAAIIVEFIRLFSFDVDFQREIWPGNKFEVVFDRSMAKHYGDIQEGNIQYAKLVLRDHTLELTRYVDKDGRVEYFNNDGKSVRKALMKTPIDGARLSSSFNPNRKHPVLGYRRAHKGVDFSAPTGTPIMAAGDGVVERASYYGSFGNYVRIRHNGTWKTAYAHLSKYGRGIKSGTRVKQGQIIGYVGATGRVTGRHLHYEVHKNGTAINPMKMKLPSGRVLKGSELATFKQGLDILMADMGEAEQFENLRLATDEGLTPINKIMEQANASR